MHEGTPGGRRIVRAALQQGCTQDWSGITTAASFLPALDTGPPPTQPVDRVAPRADPGDR